MGLGHARRWDSKCKKGPKHEAMGYIGLKTTTTNYHQENVGIVAMIFWECDRWLYLDLKHMSVHD